MNTFILKLAFRNILRNRLSSIINILGFSIGIASSLFILLFIKYENSFDNFYPNSERLYRIITTTQTKDNIENSGFANFPVAIDIRNEIPGIDNYCRVSDLNSIKCFIGKRMIGFEKFRFVDESFFNFFDINMIAGNSKTALNSANQIVLTEAKSRQLFGNTNPIGQTINYNHNLFTVSGIVSNPPSNTHLDFDALGPVKYIEQSNEYWKGWGGGITFLSYLLLSENISSNYIEKALPDFLFKKINQKYYDLGWKFSITLQNITDVHLSSKAINYDCSSNRSKKSIYIVTSISFLILLLVIVNYVILFTAQKISKTKDIGIFKIHGAGKYNLIFQTYSEVFIISFISAIIGIILLKVALPFLNIFLQTSVLIEDNILFSIGSLISTILILTALITILSTYRIITSQAIDVINYKAKSNYSKQLKTNLLVSFQFATVIILLISVFIITRQNKYLINKDLGFEKDNVLSIIVDDNIVNNGLINFKQDLLQLSSVQNVCLSSQTIGQWLTQNGYVLEGAEETSMINVVYTDADFLKFFGLQLIEGKNFSQNKELNKNEVLVNQQLVKKAGWDNALEKKINRNGELHVVGVVKDFNFSSLENSIQPLIIMANPEWDGWGYFVLSLRIQTNEIQSIITQIDKLWKARFPETPYEISFMDSLLADNYQQLHSQQNLISFFSLLSIFIALIGLFGLAVFNTQKRTKEIGIRKVNGAKALEIMVMFNKDFLKLVVIAFVIACPIAWYAMNKWLENFAYKTELSWWIFALAGLLAFLVALLTVSWQSWRAATRNPVESLRYE